MATIDIFNNDAFSVVSLTDAVQDLEYQPSLLRDMGLFEVTPIRTTTVAMERKGGVITLIPTTSRGAPIIEGSKEGRNIRHANTSRLAKGDTIYADELQNVRAFGNETEVQAVQTEVADRFNGIQQDMELTEEHMYLGAVQGKVVDADGKSVIYDWYTFWGVSKPSAINFDLVTNKDTRGTLKKQCRDLVRAMTKSAQGSFTPSTEIVGLCGDDFFDNLTNHIDVTGNAINPIEAQRLTDTYGTVYSAVRIGDITWINYRGTDDGSKVAIGTNEVKFFPKGVKGMFKHALAPAEFMPYVNTRGQRRYAMTIPDRDRGAFVRVELYSYPLVYCTRPEVLRSGTGS